MKILIWNRESAKQRTSNDSTFFKNGFFDDALFISINGYTHWDGQYNEQSPINPIFKDKTLYLCFDDQTTEHEKCEDVVLSLKPDQQSKWVDKKFKLFSKDDANKIVNFFKTHLTEDINKIIVHCTAGISRSGAVGSVLNDYFNRFLKNNKEDWEWMYSYGIERHIDPNPHVNSILKSVLGMSYDI